MPSPYDFYNIEPDIIGFYITAYGIAVKHGFVGTEPEWIASLKGEPGTSTEMRYNSDLDQIEWRLKTDNDWTGVLPLSVIRGTAFDEAVASIQASTADARQSKEAAAGSAALARSEAEKASTERQGAESAKESAEEARAGAEQEKNLTSQIRSQVEGMKSETEGYLNQTLTAKDGADGASEKAEQKALTASLAERNAREYMQSSEQSSKISQSWAVGGTGEREGEDTNNAKYWSEQAHNAAGGGVVSFNGRTGAVLPQESDYSTFFPETANNLTTNEPGKILDALQGKILNDTKLNKTAKAADSAKLNGKPASDYALSAELLSAKTQLLQAQSDIQRLTQQLNNKVGKEIDLGFVNVAPELANLAEGRYIFQTGNGVGSGYPFPFSGFIKCHIEIVGKINKVGEQGYIKLTFTHPNTNIYYRHWNNSVFADWIVINTTAV